MKSYLWAIFAALVWGMVPFFEKIGLAKVPVWIGLFYRCLGVVFGLLILLIYKFPDIKNSIVQGTSGWYYLVAAGFLASIIGQVGFYNALKTGEVSKVTPIAGAYPFVTFVLGILVLHEKITISKVIGAVFVLIGVVLLK